MFSYWHQWQPVDAFEEARERGVPVLLSVGCSTMARSVTVDTQDDQVGGEIDAWGADQLAASPEWAPEQYVHVRSCLEGDSVLEQLLTAGHGFDAGARGPPRTCERRADHAFGTHADG